METKNSICYKAPVIKTRWYWQRSKYIELIFYKSAKQLNGGKIAFLLMALGQVDLNRQKDKLWPKPHTLKKKLTQNGSLT